MKDLSKLLQKIGLSKKESVVYLTNLQFGTVPASVVARRSGLNRATTYDILSSLIKKGLVNKYIKAEVQYFTAIEPERLIDYLENKKQQIDQQKQLISESLTKLQAVKDPSITKPKVTFYEGEEGMKSAYEDTLTADKEILAYATVEEMKGGLPGYFPTYFDRRTEKGIFIKTIGPDTEGNVYRHALDKIESRDFKLVPKDKFYFTPEINIYNNKVLIASWKEKLAVIIESQEIADAQRTIFNMAWETADRYEKQFRRKHPGFKFLKKRERQE